MPGHLLVKREIRLQCIKINSSVSVPAQNDSLNFNGSENNVFVLSEGKSIKGNPFSCQMVTQYLVLGKYLWRAVGCIGPIWPTNRTCNRAELRNEFDRSEATPTLCSWGHPSSCWWQHPTDDNEDWHSDNVGLWTFWLWQRELLHC